MDDGAFEPLTGRDVATVASTVPHPAAFGNVFITPSDNPSAAELRHENRHATQWARLGDAFLPMYGLFQANAEFTFATNAILGVNGNYAYSGCYNPLEIGAGLEDGNYLT